MNTKRPKLILIDGTALAYRNHFSMIRNPLRNSKGVNTSALLGTLNSILKIIKNENPDMIITAFDSPKPTFRHERYIEYKSTRAKMPDELRELLPVIKEAIDALNIPVFEVDGVEADDVVGTVAKMASNEGFNTIIYTGDKDFLQLVSNNISMLVPGRGNAPDQLWTIENAHEKFGVTPEQILDYMALVGDASDNIPGVSGIGEKTALELINQWGSLDNIYKNLDKIKSPLRQKLERGRENAYLSRELARIKTDIKINIDFEKSKVREPNKDKLLPILKEYELASLIRRFFPTHSDTATRGENYVLVQSIDELKALTETISNFNRVCIDTETTSEDDMKAELVGISVAVEPHNAYYIPLGHRQEGGLFNHPKNLPVNEALELFKKILENKNIEKVGQNLKYDYKVLYRHGIKLAGDFFDTMLAGYLLEPGVRQHGLDFLALKYLDHQMTTYKDITRTGKKQIPFEQVSPEEAAQYSCEDADITLRLSNIFKPKLEELKLWNLFREIETPLIKVLADMEMTGISIDVPKLLELEKILNTHLVEKQKKVYELADEEFNIDSPKQLGHILFEKFNLTPKRKTKTGYSTDAEVLEEYALEGVEIAKHIVEYRELSKLLSTYVEALPKLINSRTKRIHTTYNQAVTATGRLSSTNPNLQNIPIRGEWGMKIRECFVPSDGYLLMSADYSQIELRLMAHFSQDSTLIEAFNKGLDIHSHTASLVTGIPQEDITPELRRMAKTVNFGIMYGMSHHGLAMQLGITHEEAMAFINNYFSRYPNVKEYMESIVAFAEKNGFVETVLGRRRYIPEILSESKQQRESARRIAINTPLQGSAADIIKLAMIQIHRRLHKEKFSAKMLLQVHDELVFEFPVEEEKSLTELVREEMSNVVKLAVPIVVDINIGKNWADAHR